MTQQMNGDVLATLGHGSSGGGEQAVKVLAARAAGTQVRGDIREAALGRLSAIHDDDMIEADPLPAVGKGGRAACTWGFIRPPGAPGGRNVADGEPNAPAQLVDLLLDRRPGAGVLIERPHSVPADGDPRTGARHSRRHGGDHPGRRGRS